MTCYKKDVTCDKDDQLCKVQKFLQGLPFDETYCTYKIDSNIKPNTKLCNRCKREPKKITGGSSNGQCNCNCNSLLTDPIKQIIVTLKTADFLICKKDKILTGFVDIKPINFLPTCKRDPADGKFLLCKEGKGRLPGYADRIMTNKIGDIVKGSCKYEPLCMIGNDHLPIYGSFSIKP